MSEILTNTGLMLPEDCTEEEFFEAGRFLSRIEQGMQWAIGDWYNAIERGTGNKYHNVEGKKSACERAGIDPKTAATYASVCSVFTNSTRVEQVSFDVHRRIAVRDLTSEQRLYLLSQAASQRWSGSRITKERDRLLGRDERVPLLTFDAKVEKLMETLPAAATKKTKTALKQVVADLRHDFETEVEHVLQDRLKAQRERLHKLEKEAQEERDRARNLRMNLDGLMTEEEYRLVRSCLHPDRAPEDRKTQFTKAFDIFTRLEKSVNRDMPAELRKQRGWS